MGVKYLEGDIREFDMKAASTSILRERNMINDDVYYDLIEGNKNYRNVIIGKLIRDIPELYNTISSDIEKYTNMFISANKIPQKNVLEIAKDAVFTINVKGSGLGKSPVLRFGDFIIFDSKSVYCSCLEFTPKDNSSLNIKLYLTFDSSRIKCRFGTINYDNPIYSHVLDAMRCKINCNKREFGNSIRRLTKYIKLRPNAPQLISNVDNDRLVEVFKEFAIL